MVTRTRKPAAPKVITVIARYMIKRNSAILYTFKPSKANTPAYIATVVSGRATGCTCPARNFGHSDCKHMVESVRLEALRRIDDSANDLAMVAATTKAIAEHNAKEAQDRADFVALFNPCYNN